MCLILFTCVFKFSANLRETEEAVVENEKIVSIDKPSGEEDAGDANKETPVNEQEEKEPEEKAYFLIQV